MDSTIKKFLKVIKKNILKFSFTFTIIWILGFVIRINLKTDSPQFNEYYFVLKNVPRSLIPQAKQILDDSVLNGSALGISQKSKCEQKSILFECVLDGFTEQTLTKDSLQTIVSLVSISAKTIYDDHFGVIANTTKFIDLKTLKELKNRTFGIEVFTYRKLKEVSDKLNLKNNKKENLNKISDPKFSNELYRQEIDDLIDEGTKFELDSLLRMNRISLENIEDFERIQRDQEKVFEFVWEKIELKVNFRDEFSKAVLFGLSISILIHSLALCFLLNKESKA